MSDQAPQHLHLHLKDFDGTVEIDLGGNTVKVTPSSERGVAAAAPVAVGTWSPKVEEMVERHEGYDTDSRSRELLAELVERGWTLVDPKMNTYVRAEYGGKVSVYVRSALISFVGKLEQEVAAATPGAEKKPHEVRLRHSGPGSDYDAVIEALAALEKAAA